MTPLNHLYRTLWRWHFYAGLFCLPFVLVLSITGAVYLFKPQIEYWSDKSFHNLSTVTVRSTPQEQIERAKQHLAGARFVSYRVPQSEREAVIITLSLSGARHLVYINPYTMEVLKDIAYDSQFIRIVRALHGELLLSDTGAVLVELAGCWAIILIVTGLYLWWPRNSQGLAGVLYPRLRQGGRRFWRDLHATIGFWVALGTLFLLISGLPWALVWGSAFKEIRALGQPSVSQAWQVRHHHANETSSDSSQTLTQELLAGVAKLGMAAPIELKMTSVDTPLWQASSQHQNRMLRTTAWFDSSGQLVKTESFADRPVVDQIIGVGISAHEGHLFGWFNQLLGLLVAIGLCLVCLSGFVLWRRRKPEGRLGAPVQPLNSRTTKAVFWITLMLSLLLPVVAISLVIMTIVERTVLKKMPHTRRWLGV